MLSNLEFPYVKRFRFDFLEIECFSECDWEPHLLLDAGVEREMMDDKIMTIDRDLTCDRIVADSDGLICEVSANDKQSGEIDRFRIYLFKEQKDFMKDWEQSTYREQIMLKGFYVGHHFGAPAYYKLFDDAMVFVTTDPNRIVWSFAVKYLLTVKSIQHGWLHLKAGAIEWNGRAILLLGRGGSGKTVLIEEMCKEKAKLVSNTHACVQGKMVSGMKTKVRYRENGTERFVDPRELLNGRVTNNRLEISGIFWVQYRTDDVVNIAPLNADVLYHNAKLFSEAICNWELKEDIVDYFQNDMEQVARTMHVLDSGLKELCNTIPAYYLNVNIHNPKARESVIKLLDQLIH